MEYLPTVLNNDSTEETWTDLGSALGALNQLTGDHPFALRIAGALRDQITSAEGTVFERGVRHLIDRLGAAVLVAASGIIHGEANPSNAGRRANDDLVLLDYGGEGCPAELTMVRRARRSDTLEPRKHPPRASVEPLLRFNLQRRVTRPPAEIYGGRDIARRTRRPT